MQEEIKKIIAQSLGIEITDIDNESLLVEDLGLHAEDLASIFLAISDRYNIEMDLNQASEIKTLEDLFDLVSTYVPEELD